MASPIRCLQLSRGSPSIASQAAANLRVSVAAMEVSPVIYLVLLLLLEHLGAQNTIEGLFVLLDVHTEVISSKRCR